MMNVEKIIAEYRKKVIERRNEELRRELRMEALHGERDISVCANGLGYDGRRVAVPQ